MQELFEARNPKGRAVISEVDGVVDKIESNAAEHLQEITVKGKIDTRVYTIPYTAKPAVQEGDEIHRGDKLIPGSIDPKELIKVTDTLTTEEYILAEVQKSYRTQGVDLADKHAEVLTRQMLQKVRVLDPGETDILPGEVMDIAEFRDRNATLSSAAGFLQLARLTSWVSPRQPWKLTVSCQLLPSKKPREFLLTPQSAARTTHCLV